MANDLNLCQFIGRLGDAPQIRYTAGGDAVANVSIATGWKSKDKEGAEWVRCTAFGKLAEIMGEYLQKGSQVYVSGRMRTRKWVNDQGQDQYTTEIVLNQMQMLGGRDEGGGMSGDQQGGGYGQQNQAPQAAGRPNMQPQSAPPAMDDFDDDQV